MLLQNIRHYNLATSSPSASGKFKGWSICFCLKQKLENKYKLETKEKATHPDVCTNMISVKFNVFCKQNERQQ